jgi:hypothetical protein
MVGDNIYGGSSAKDFEKKFEAPYKALLDSGVKFYAALGNHDDPKERFYKPFNMNGERFLLVQASAQRERSLLRARQATTWTTNRSSGWTRSCGERIGLEDRVLSPPAVFVGRHTRLGHGPSRPARARCS